MGDVLNGLARGQEVVRVPAMTKPANPGRPLVGGAVTKEGTSLLRIEVGESGLYRIEAADIVDGLGVSANTAAKLIRTGGLSLTTRNKPVSYLCAADASGLYFYGEAIDSTYATYNVYWLSVAKGKLMSSGSKFKSNTAPSTRFTDTLHAEENVFAYTPPFHDPDADFWLWNYVVAGEIDGGRYSDHRFET